MAVVKSLTELIRLLNATENIEALAREAGLSSKTLYRIRAGENIPNLATFERLIAVFEARHRAARVRVHVPDDMTSLSESARSRRRA